MTVFTFSTLANNQRIAFNPASDTLDFDLPGASAGAVRLARSGASLAFTFAGKTIFLDGVALNQLDAERLVFAGGGALVVGDGTTDPFADFYGADYSGLAGAVAGNLQVWGLGGADLIATGAGNDVLVGNDALTVLTHVSRVGATGSPTGARGATVSADGRFVAFEGGWTGFGSSSDSALDVLVKDMVTGTVTNEHKSASGDPGLSGSGDPVISADGRSLAFVSSSQLLSPTITPSNTVFVASTISTAIEAVSRTAGGVFGNEGGANPDLSADGRYVVFESRSSNLAAGGNVTFEDIYLKDRATGALTRISTSLTGGDGNGESRYAKISADGRYVVFQSAASNLTAADNNGRIDIFLWDRETGGLTNITGGKTGSFDSLRPDVAYDNVYGGVVVFDTGAALVAADTNNAEDVYAYDIASGTFSLVSAAANGTVSATGAQEGSVSGDGRFVVFRSFSSNLVPGDTNGYADIFVKDLYTGEIALVSRLPGAEGNQHASASPEISLGGDWIVFSSAASNLAATDGNAGLPDVFRVSNPLLKDTLQGGAGNDTYIIARNDVIIEQPNGGIDLVQSSISYTLGANLENLQLTGTANLNGTGNAGNNVITGNAGANRLSGLGGNDVLNGAAGDDTLLGGLGNDRLLGGLGADSLVGGEGLDTLDGGDGNDTLDGGIGNDRLFGGAGNDSLIGGEGNDTIEGGPGNDTGAGGNGDDLYIVDSAFDIIIETGTIGTNGDTVQSSVSWSLGPTLEHLVLTGSDNLTGNGNGTANLMIGNAGDNRLSGFAGDDTIDGGDGNDTLDGGIGNDRLIGGAGNDSLFGGAGDDTIEGGPGNDTSAGGNGDDLYIVDSAFDIIIEAGTIGTNGDTVQSSVSWSLGPTLEHLVLTGSDNLTGNGNGTANLMIGNAGNNRLSGFAGDDTIDGGDGNDTLDGGIGNDRLIGGEGNDVLIGGRGSDLLTGGAGADVFVFNSLEGSDTVTDFTSRTDKMRFSMAAFGIGDGDLLVEGAMIRNAPGGFGVAAELVIFTANAGALDAAGAAARIGAADAAYEVGAKRLFAIDNGVSSAIFLFTAADADAVVSAAELTRIATLSSTPATVLADYVFVA